MSPFFYLSPSQLDDYQDEEKTITDLTIRHRELTPMDSSSATEGISFTDENLRMEWLLGSLCHNDSVAILIQEKALVH